MNNTGIKLRNGSQAVRMISRSGFCSQGVYAWEKRADFDGEPIHGLF